MLGQVERIAQSEVFRSSEALQRLLIFLAEKSALGEAKHLKEYTIGVDGMGRPASYDPRHDAAVRIQVGRLRQKLAEYYHLEGKEDPLVIELPKGQFKLTCQNRPQEVKEQNPEGEFPWRRALLWVACGLLLSLAWGAYEALLLSRKGEPATRSDWTPELQELWQPFVRSDRPLVVMMADPLFIQFKGFGTYRNVVVNTWDEAKSSPSVATVRKAFKNAEMEPNFRYTGVSEANASFLLGRLLSSQVSHISLARSSELSWSQLANNNVIYVGAERIIADRMRSLPVAFEFTYDYLGVRNVHPRPGEPAFFSNPIEPSNTAIAEDGEAYALVSQIPGPVGQGGMETFTSDSAPARLAAVQWFTSPTGAKDLVARLKQSSGQIPTYYQVLLRIKFKSGIPTDTSYVMHRELHPEAPAATAEK